MSAIFFSGYVASKVAKPLWLIIGGFTVSSIIFTVYKKKWLGIAISCNTDLPIGLPNPRNICYFNALMQAIAANESLVRLIQRNALRRPSKFVYRLLCLLKGLQCSAQFIATNNLEKLLEENHKLLLNDIIDKQQWTFHEQQDAHELFGHIMDRVYSSDIDCNLDYRVRKLSDLFNFHLASYERIVLSCSYFSIIETAKLRSTLCYFIPTRCLEQNLVASQVTCNNCTYRSRTVIQPEACLTVFLKSSEIEPVSRKQINLKVLSESSNTHITSLKEYLAAQCTTVESLPDMKCPKCMLSANSLHSTPTKFCQRKQWIVHIPNYLVLYIQRVDWVDLSGLSYFGKIDRFSKEPSFKSATRIVTKRSDHIDIPDYLDMGSYLLSNESLNKSRSHISCASGDKQSQDSSNYTHSRPYFLRSVVVHQGVALQSGHYIAYRKWPIRSLRNQVKAHWIIQTLSNLYTYISNFFKGIPNQRGVPSSPWLLTSDLNVMRVPSKEVQTSSAYLLFYERPFTYDKYSADEQYISTVCTPNNASSSNHDSYSYEKPEEDTHFTVNEDTCDLAVDWVLRRPAILSRAETIRTYASAASTL